MTPEILAYLKNETSDYAPTKLASTVHHWRDRLQTEDARLALTDDLALESSTATDAQVDAALTTWGATAESAWLAYAAVANIAALAASVQTALASDTLQGWAGAHDALGACGIASVDWSVGSNVCACCFSAARLAPYTESAGPVGLDGQPTVVRAYKTYDATVSALQASLRAVLVGLCGG